MPSNFSDSPSPALQPLVVSGPTASAKTAMDKSYPVARALFMFTRGKPTGVVKAFLDFVKSAKGQKIAEEEGFVPIK